MSSSQKLVFGLAFIPAAIILVIGSVTRAFFPGDFVDSIWNILSTAFLAISSLPIVHLCSGFRVSEIHPHLRRYATAEFWSDVLIYLPLVGFTYLILTTKAINLMDQMTFYVHSTVFICSLLSLALLCYKGKHPLLNELIVPLNEAEQAECGLREAMNQKDVVLLFGAAKRSDEPSASGYCQKVETFLRVTSTRYEHREILPFKGPKGKIPFMEINGETVADSHFMLRHLIKTGVSKDPDAVLTREQKADTRAYQKEIEELIYPCTVRERWTNDKNYQVIKQERFGSMIWPLRAVLSWFIRRNIIKALWSHGVGRHSEEQIQSIVSDAFEDLDVKYSHGENYFHRTENPTEIDIIVYSFIVNALQTYSNPFVSQQILSKPHLVKFTKMMTNKLFPEYHGILKRLELLQ